MKCKDCKNLKNRSTYGQCYAHEGCKICRDSNAGCIMFEPAIQTNGDRLRAISNEELADKVTLCPTSFDKNFYCKLNNCRKCLLDWLNSPAESEVNHER